MFLTYSTTAGFDDVCTEERRTPRDSPLVVVYLVSFPKDDGLNYHWITQTLHRLVGSTRPPEFIIYFIR